MAELSNKPVWVVHDPSPDYVQSDAAPYKTTFGRLAVLIAGTGIRTWHQEDTALYDNAREAQADADKRWARHEAKKGKRASYSYDRS